MMSENGYTLSLELQKAVKNYLLANSDKYQQAMKKTGPIDNTSLYRKVSSQSDSAPAIFSLDDPYWQDFIEKNSARTQQWRVPSSLAWNHKQNGIVGEVVDIKKIRENFQKMRQLF